VVFASDFGRGTFMIVPGGDAKFAQFMKRHAPAVVEGVMRRSVRKAQSQIAGRRLDYRPASPTAPVTADREGH